MTKHPIKIYADTSVYGGIIDEEFAEASHAFFDRPACGLGNHRRMQRHCELEFQAHRQFQKNTALQCGQYAERVSPDCHTLATGGDKL